MWRTRNQSSFEDNELIVRVPPHMTEQLPNSNLVIDSLNSRFFDSIRHLKRCDIIGVSLLGKNIGRRGHLEWLCLSTSVCTYLYDIRELQKEAFNSGLKAILENKEIIKVLHDCRMPSDHLFHVYQSELTSVFDTQASDFIIRVQSEKIENINNTANTLDYCLQKYLQIPEDYLFKSSDCSFDERPLNDSARNSLIKDVIYLRLLRKEQDLRLHTPFRRCVDVFLNTLILKSDDELKLHPPDKTKVPPELFLEDMMVFEINQSLKPKTETVAKCKNDEDPYLRYQRLILKNQQEMKGVDRANEINLNTSNHYGVGNSTRRDVVDFLMDKMYADGYPDRNCCSRASIFGDEEMKCNINSLVDQTPPTSDDSSVIDVRNISPTLFADKVSAVNISPEIVDRQIRNKHQSFESLNPSSNSSGKGKKAKCDEIISYGYLSRPHQLLAKVGDSSLSSKVIVNSPKGIKTDSCKRYKQYLEVCNSASISELSDGSVSSKVNDESPKAIETDSCKRYEQYLEDLKAGNNVASQDDFCVNRSYKRYKQYLEVCNRASISELSDGSVSSKVNDESPKAIETDSCKRYEQYLEDLKAGDNVASRDDFCVNRPLARKKALLESLRKKLERCSNPIPNDSLNKCDIVHNSNKLEVSVISELQSSVTNVKADMTQTFSMLKKETNLENELKTSSNHSQLSEQWSELVKPGERPRFETRQNLCKDSDEWNDWSSDEKDSLSNCKILETSNTLVKSSDNAIEGISNGATSLSITTKSEHGKTIKKDECYRYVNSELESRATYIKSDATLTYASVKEETNLNKNLTETRPPQQSEKPRVLMYLRNKHPGIEVKQNGGCVFTYTDWPSDEDYIKSDCKILETNDTPVKSSDGDNITVEKDDPWSKLREAFAELGPPIIDKKTRFIPAGMQY